MSKIFILLALAFVLVSCDNDGVTNGTPNPFIGTWESEISGFHLVFAKTTATSLYPNGDVYWTGTYTYNETHITVKLDQAASAQEMVETWGDSRMIPYGFEGDILRFNYSSFTKIKE